MNVLIIENDIEYQNKIQRVVNELGYRNYLKNDLLGEFDINNNESESFDFLICNTEMYGKSIFLKNEPSLQIPIIFPSNTKEFKDSLKTKNSRILIKPFSDLILKALIVKLIKESKFSTEIGITVFGIHKNQINVPINEILYIASEGNYSNVITNNNKYVIKRSSKLLINNISDHFLRVRRSTYINKSKITNISIKESKVYVGNVSFTVTRDFKKDVYLFHNKN